MVPTGACCVHACRVLEPVICSVDVKKEVPANGVVVLLDALDESDMDSRLRPVVVQFITTWYVALTWHFEMNGCLWHTTADSVLHLCNSFGCLVAAMSPAASL